MPKLPRLKITAAAVIGLFAITGSFAPPANADCSHRGNPDHRHCDDDFGNVDDPADEYIANWTGGVSGTSFPGAHPILGPRDWILGNKKLIGLNIGGLLPADIDRNVGQLTDLDFFRALGDFEGANCFDDTAVVPVDGYLAQGHVIKGKRGRAEAHFWFSGYTEFGPQSGDAERILYKLLLIGENDRSTPENEAFDPDVWPPTGTTTMTMDTWTLSIEGEGDVRDISCVGSGDFGSGASVFIDVELQ